MFRGGLACRSAWPINNRVMAYTLCRCAGRLARPTNKCVIVYICGIIMIFIPIFMVITFTLIVILITLVFIVMGIGIFVPCIMPYMVWSVRGIMLYPPSPPVSLAINE